MQGLLSFDQAPPLGVPVRFFLTAPLFGMAGAALLFASGPDLLASRWTAQALAFTHLLTAGFMLQIMLGALQQLFPVVLGANFSQPERTAGWIHAPVTLGAIALAGGFLLQHAWLFALAMVLLGLGILAFLVAAMRALSSVNWRASPMARGFWIVLAGLLVTVLLGLTLAGALAQTSTSMPLVLLTQLHVGWGFLVWCSALVATVAFTVVPMFLVTPDYPALLVRFLVPGLFLTVVAWSAALVWGWPWADPVLGGLAIVCMVVFCGCTWRLLQQTKRGKRETLHQFWQLSLLSTLAACALWLVQSVNETVAHWPPTVFLLATLVLLGACGSVMMGMLYKIVPFLIWQHLQNQGKGQVLAPNMKKIIAQTRMDRQIRSLALALILLLLACIWPTWLVYPAALALFGTQLVLLLNLWHAYTLYKTHLTTIAAALRGQPAVA